MVLWVHTIDTCFFTLVGAPRLRQRQGRTVERTQVGPGSYAEYVQTCPACEGAGIDPASSCGSCRGQGVTQVCVWVGDFVLYAIPPPALPPFW